MKSMLFIVIMAALTIVVTTTASFGFILATAQTMANNASMANNMTNGGSNSTETDQKNQTGSIAGIDRVG
jgi:Flp pilus assembly protein TadG